MKVKGFSELFIISWKKNIGRKNEQKKKLKYILKIRRQKDSDHISEIKTEYFYRLLMINGLVASVEWEHEILKWNSSIANSLAFICNTVHKQSSVASNGSA